MTWEQMEQIAKKRALNLYNKQNKIKQKRSLYSTILSFLTGKEIKIYYIMQESAKYDKDDFKSKIQDKTKENNLKFDNAIQTQINSMKANIEYRSELGFNYYTIKVYATSDDYKLLVSKAIKYFKNNGFKVTLDFSGYNYTIRW